MKLETLKQLIEQITVSQTEIDDWEGNIEDAVIHRVIKLIELYEQDQIPTSPINYPPGVRKFEPYPPSPPKNPYYPNSDNDMVPYGEICSCNPKNGGSGVCGCIIGNKLVPKPSDKSNSTFGPRNEDC
jgi:hypothetical protein